MTDWKNLVGTGPMILTDWTKSSSVTRDYPVVSGVNLFFTTGVVLLILLIDLIYPYLDPRVRYE